jgi:hypothetical protein
MDIVTIISYLTLVVIGVFGFTSVLTGIIALPIAFVNGILGISRVLLKDNLNLQIRWYWLTNGVIGSLVFWYLISLLWELLNNTEITIYALLAGGISVYVIYFNREKDNLNYQSKGLMYAEAFGFLIFFIRHLIDIPLNS